MRHLQLRNLWQEENLHAPQMTFGTALKAGLSRKSFLSPSLSTCLTETCSVDVSAFFRFIGLAKISCYSSGSGLQSSPLINAQFMANLASMLNLNGPPLTLHGALNALTGPSCRRAIRTGIGKREAAWQRIAPSWSQIRGLVYKSDSGVTT